MKTQVAVITGGAGHIGEATCAKLVEQGAQLAIVDKNRSAGLALVDRLTNQSKKKHIFCEVDLMDPKSFTQVRVLVEKEFGQADFLVNNAAFYDDAPGWGVPFDQEGYEAWEKVMRINLLAPFFMVQALTPLLEKSPKASVVNISSIYGVVGPDHSLYSGTDMTNPAAYSASKGGLIQLTKWLSMYLAPKIRVNTVTPGGIERGQLEVFVNRYKAKTPLGRMTKEQDVANAISFLLSSESAYITGQNLIVDGGWTVW